MELVKRIVRLRNDLVDAHAAGHIDMQEYRVSVAALNRAKEALADGAGRHPAVDQATPEQLRALADMYQGKGGRP
jgi:hypothetical protein